MSTPNGAVACVRCGQWVAAATQGHGGPVCYPCLAKASVAHAQPTAPQPPSDIYRKVRIGWVIAVLVVAAVGAVKWVATGRWSLRDAQFHNARDVDATVTIEDRTFEVPAGGWAAHPLPPGGATAQIVFADGLSEKLTVEDRTGPCHLDYEAFSLQGEGCYAMVDVTPLYDADQGDDLLRVLHSYRDTSQLGFGVSCDDATLVQRHGEDVGATYIDPKHDVLPDEVIRGRGAGRFAMLRSLPCDHLDDPKRMDHWLAEIR